MIFEDELLRRINDEGETAYGILVDVDRNFEKRFNRVCRTIRELLADVKKEFPDANYYTASGGFNLMIGPTHADNGGQPQQELMALSGRGMDIGDGDF